MLSNPNPAHQKTRQPLVAVPGDGSAVKSGFAVSLGNGTAKLMQSTNSSTIQQRRFCESPQRQALADALVPDPRLSNTGVPSSQAKQESPQNTLLPGGVDYLDVSLYGAWPVQRWAELRDKFDEQKEIAVQLNASFGDGYGHIETDEGDIVLVEPNGWAGGVFCRWAFTFPGGIRLGVVDRQEFIEGRPSIRVHISSMPCMVNGEEESLARVRKLLSSLGFVEAEDAGISRIDVCVDLPGVSTHQLVEMFEAEQVITRADKAQTFRDGRKKTGFVIGSRSSVMLRTYDKTEETKHNPDKAQVMTERRWGGQKPENATRVEFQIPRAWLAKRFGVRKLEDWRKQRAAIVEYLVHHWFRLTDEPVDYENKHQSRAKVADVWKRVQECFAEAFGENLEAWLPIIKRAPENVEPIVVQAAGCVSTVFAKLGIDVAMGPVSAMAELVRIMEPHLERIAKDTERKTMLFRFSSPLGPDIPDDEIPF